MLRINSLWHRCAATTRANDAMAERLAATWYPRWHRTRSRRRTRKIHNYLAGTPHKKGNPPVATVMPSRAKLTTQHQPLNATRARRQRDCRPSLTQHGNCLGGRQHIRQSTCGVAAVRNSRNIRGTIHGQSDTAISGSVVQQPLAAKKNQTVGDHGGRREALQFPREFGV